MEGAGEGAAGWWWTRSCDVEGLNAEGSDAEGPDTEGPDAKLPSDSSGSVGRAGDDDGLESALDTVRPLAARCLAISSANDPGGTGGRAPSADTTELTDVGFVESA